MAIHQERPIRQRRGRPKKQFWRALSRGLRAAPRAIAKSVRQRTSRIGVKGYPRGCPPPRRPDPYLRTYPLGRHRTLAEQRTRTGAYQLLLPVPGPLRERPRPANSPITLDPSTKAMLLSADTATEGIGQEKPTSRTCGYPYPFCLQNRLRLQWRKPRWLRAGQWRRLRRELTLPS